MKNSLKLIILLSFFLVTLYAQEINECKTDIYFGNGVWNEPEDAEKSIIRLQKLINKEIIKNNPKLQAKYGKVKLQYNWGQGAMLDVLETYYQLKEAGQVTDYQFFAVIAILTRGDPALTFSAITSQKLIEPLTQGWEQGNVDDMSQKYYDESFKLSHKVLLVSHSQGNMFANRAYDNINPTEYKNYFANLQVASPASEVKAEKGDYVTLSTDLTSADPIINPIPGSMSPNASGDSGHVFVSAYLSQADPLAKITKKIKQLLANLDTESSQWELDQELNKGTKDYKITLKHRFDTVITSMQDVEVYPFKPSEKLYRVTDNTSGNGWVKATCGGEEVFDSWNEQKDNEIYLINNLDLETITLGLNLKYDTVLFIFDRRWENTSDWNNWNVDFVWMYLYGRTEGHDDVLIAQQQSNITPVLNGDWGYEAYVGNHRPQPLLNGSNIFYKTSDVEELKSLIEDDVPLQSTTFDFTKEMYDKLVN